MSNLATPIPPDPSPEPVFRLSVEQYHAMIESGVLTDDDPVELLEGILVFKMPKKPLHRLALRKLFKAIDAIVPIGTFLQLQEPITLSNGEPEPDAAIIRGIDADFSDRHPGPSEVLLVVEVSDSTLARDRGIKLRSYAAAGIAVYWIVDLSGRSIEVYTDPHAADETPSYRQRRVYGKDDEIPIDFAGARVAQVRVSALLP